MAERLPTPRSLSAKVGVWAAVVAVGLSIAGAIYNTAATLNELSVKSDRNCRLEVALDRDVRILLLTETHGGDHDRVGHLIEEALRTLPEESC